MRESLEIADDRAIELLTQTACGVVTAFLFVHRIWEVTRTGRYHWKKDADRWQIDRVEVIEEHVSGRFQFGWQSSIERR